MIVIGPKFEVGGILKKCEACQFRRNKNCLLSNYRDVSNNILDGGYFNVWGLANTILMVGFRYYTTIINDHIKKMWVYFTKKKSEVFTHY